MKRFACQKGFSLIELTVVLVIIGIMLAVAMTSMLSVTKDVRQVKTEEEMDMLADAIVGNPRLLSGGARSDFGYVGDVGAFPPNLQALYTNPGLGTWNGPYLPPGLTADTLGYRMDEWGRAYTYNGGLTITSSGSGSTLTKRLADYTGDYLYNTLDGKITDADGYPPQSFADSVMISLICPDGSGNYDTRYTWPDSAGFFEFDSIPVGHHELNVIYTPLVDTLSREVTILPRHKTPVEYRFASTYFSSSYHVIGETDVIFHDQTGTTWYPITLNNSYINPVVAMNILTENGNHPCHIRVRNVSAAAFEWRIEEWDYLDDDHYAEDCPYLVIEAGIHTLDDGTVIQAGYASTNQNWVTVNFDQAFSSTPALITGIASHNDPAPCIERTQNLNTTGFEVKLQEEEAADGIHPNENVAWIAIQTGPGSHQGTAFLAGHTSNSVTDDWYDITFSPAFSTAPVFLCSIDTYNGNNPCSMRFRSLSQYQVQVHIDEEQSNDSETDHIPETVSYFAWGTPGDIVR